MTDRPYSGYHKATGSQPFDKGRDVVRFGRSDEPEGANYKTNPQGSNAVLSDGAEYVNLWVTDVITDVALAGSTGQSAQTRTFYGRNFVMPSIQILGQAPSQQDYGRMVEFIHWRQQQAVRSGALTQFSLHSGGPTEVSNMKGNHRDIIASGYFQTVARQHTRFEYAPSYTLNFIVAHMHEGLYHDDNVKVNYLKSWAQIVDDIKKRAGDPNYSSTTYAPSTQPTAATQGDTGLPAKILQIIGR